MRVGWSARALVLEGSNRRKLLRILTNLRDLQVLSSFSCTDFFFVDFVLVVVFCIFVGDINLSLLDCSRSEFREQFKKEHPTNKSVAVVSVLVLCFYERWINTFWSFGFLCVFYGVTNFRLVKLAVIDGSLCPMPWVFTFEYHFVDFFWLNSCA